MLPRDRSSCWMMPVLRAVKLPCMSLLHAGWWHSGYDGGAWDIFGETWHARRPSSEFSPGRALGPTGGYRVWGKVYYRAISPLRSHWRGTAIYSPPNTHSRGHCEAVSVGLSADNFKPNLFHTGVSGEFETKVIRTRTESNGLV